MKIDDFHTFLSDFLEQKEFAVVEDFMKRIENNEEFNKDFKDIKFDNLDKEFSKTDELLSFKVEAKLRKK